jgi:hypothetical protein
LGVVSRKVACPSQVILIPLSFTADVLLLFGPERNIVLSAEVPFNTADGSQSGKMFDYG